MQMFLNNKPALESDLRTTFAALDDLDTIELVHVDERGNLYFEVRTFELMPSK